MNKNKILNILKKALIAGLIAITMFCTPIKSVTKQVYANINIPKIEYRCESSHNILIYNSHSCEDYENGRYTVQDGAKDLSEKLKTRGYNVTYLSSKFADMNGYNLSYKSSRSHLEQLNLDKYDLIIDYHRDEGVKRDIVKNKYGSESARLMAVLSRNYNKNFENNKKMVNEFKNIINNTYNSNIWKSQDTIYNKGICNGFNQDITKGVLIEVGDQMNTFNDIKAANTELSYAIATYLK